MRKASNAEIPAWALLGRTGTTPPDMEEPNIVLRPVYGVPPPLPADDARGATILLAILMVVSLVVLIFMVVGHGPYPVRGSVDASEDSRPSVP